MFCQFGEIVYLCTRNREITFQNAISESFDILAHSSIG